MRTLRPPTMAWTLVETCDICGATATDVRTPPAEEDPGAGLLLITWNGSGHDLFLDVCGLCYARVIGVLEKALREAFDTGFRESRYTEVT